MTKEKTCGFGAPAAAAADYEVLIFRPYPLKAGQKITIDGGPRGGDWLVVDVGERKMKLKCPITHREVEWDRFCQFVTGSNNEPWPHQD